MSYDFAPETHRPEPEAPYAGDHSTAAPAPEPLEATGTPEAPETLEPAAKSTARPAPSKAVVKRIVAKVAEVTDAPEETRRVAAALLGCSTDVSELSVAILTAPRAALGPVHDLTAIGESDPMEAGVVAATMGKDRIKAVWSLLVALDVAKGTPPASIAKAAIALAKTVFALDEIVKCELEAAIALVKKS